jgi:hypothetical protein
MELDSSRSSREDGEGIMDGWMSLRGFWLGGFWRRSSLIRTSFLLCQRSIISPPPCIFILLRYFQFQQRGFGMLSSEFRSALQQ